MFTNFYGIIGLVLALNRKLLITNWRCVINGPLTQISSILKKSWTLLMFCWKNKPFGFQWRGRCLSFLFVFYLEPVSVSIRTILDMSWGNFVYFNQYNMTAFYNKKFNTKRKRSVNLREIIINDCQISKVLWRISTRYYFAYMKRRESLINPLFHCLVL